MQNDIPQTVAAIIKGFPPQLQQEVADYVDFIRARYLNAEGKETEAWTRLSAEVWDND